MDEFLHRDEPGNGALSAADHPESCNDEFLGFYQGTGTNRFFVLSAETTSSLYQQMASVVQLRSQRPAKRMTVNHGLSNLCQSK